MHTHTEGKTLYNLRMNTLLQCVAAVNHCVYLCVFRPRQEAVWWMRAVCLDRPVVCVSQQLENGQCVCGVRLQLLIGT